MSNFLAIATVTAALEQIVLSAVTSAVTGSGVTTGRPDEPSGGNPDPRVNIFLYQVAPNPALRNADLPTRRPDGSLVHRPQTALDLYYLLTFYGEETQLEPQRLLGSTAIALHSQPLLSVNRIREAIQARPFLAGSDLEEQPERVRFTPVPLSLEVLSKLWSVFFQTPYTLSVAYQASLVLLEAEETPQAALPVRERLIRVLPFSQPQIEQVISTEGAAAPVTVGSSLRILGRGLRGDVTRVRVGDVEATPTQTGEREIVLSLSNFPPGSLRAGVRGLQVVHELLLGAPPEPHRGAASNVAPFVLRPTITGVEVPGAGTVEVSFDPRVGRSQRVVLLLNEFEPPESRVARAYQIRAPEANGIAGPEAGDTEVIAFDTSEVAPGDYLARVQVDGAESVLETDDQGRFDEPRVTIA